MPGRTIDKTLAETDAWLIDAINRHAFPGLAAGVVRDGALVYAKGFGMADAAAGRPVDAATVFRIGSISKTFTSIGLMQLWEEGRFGLDDPVNDYLRSYRLEPPDREAPPVTFRHLLTHTAGIGETRSLGDYLDFGHLIGLGADPGEPPQPLGEYYGGGLRAELAPGVKWAYANHGFATVGQLVEDISGRPFEQHMLERVFVPLGMDRTDYLPSERVRGGLAVGYALKKDGLRPVKYLEIAVRPAGSVFSSVAEMAKYLAALMNGGANENGAVLKPETLALMTEPHYQPDPRLPVAMGLSFFLDRFDGHRIISHNGGWNGFTSAMCVAPDDRLGVILFTNVSTLALDGVATGLLRRLLGVPEPSSELRSDLPETPWVWGDVRGFYGPLPGFRTNARTWLATGGEVEVYVARNRLAVRGAFGPLRRGVPLRRVDVADPLVYEAVFEGMRVPLAFHRDTDGQMDRLTAGGAMGLQTFYRRPWTRSVAFRLRAAGAAGALAAATLLARRRR